MKKIRNILIILIILIAIIVGILIATRNKNSDLIPDEVEDTSVVTISEELKKVSIRNNYYTVKDIVEKYYRSLCKLNETSDDVLVFEEEEETEDLEEQVAKEIENYKKRIYNFFNEEYIEETGLTTENIQENLGDYNELYVLIEDMYVREITVTVKVYFVFGTITEENTLESESFELMVAVDSNNSTFNIYTSDYINNNNLYELSKQEDFSEKYFNVIEIENRTYNTYDFELIDDETYVKDLFATYTQSIKYGNLDYSYNNLSEEYKASKFKTKSDYEEYISENKSNITTATIAYYNKYKADGYNQYIIIDKKGKYYVFNELATMDYELMLDIYTIDTVEFTSKYESATTEEKVMLNIQKIVEALNEKDYNYVYNKLADEFKANYFSTYEYFAEYAEETFDTGIELTYNKYTESESISTYSVTLTGANKTMSKTIVMQLLEGTDFVMSFNVE